MIQKLFSRVDRLKSMTLEDLASFSFELKTTIGIPLAGNTTAALKGVSDRLIHM